MAEEPPALGALLSPPVPPRFLRLNHPMEQSVGNRLVARSKALTSGCWAGAWSTCGPTNEGRPLRWSPMVVELVLCGLVPHKLLLHPDQAARCRLCSKRSSASPPAGPAWRPGSSKRSSLPSSRSRPCSLTAWAIRRLRPGQGRCSASSKPAACPSTTPTPLTPPSPGSAPCGCPGQHPGGDCNRPTPRLRSWRPAGGRRCSPAWPPSSTSTARAASSPRKPSPPWPTHDLVGLPGTGRSVRRDDRRQDVQDPLRRRAPRAGLHHPLGHHRRRPPKGARQAAGHRHLAQARAEAA